MAAVPRAADRIGGRSRALVAKPYVVGSITGAFAGRWRIRTEHLRAPLGTVPICTENAANPAQANEATD